MKPSKIYLKNHKLISLQQKLPFYLLLYIYIYNGIYIKLKNKV
ncbi:hypothetical protein HNQ03_003048 [Chryseobacterium sp. 16F]|uniref:Uncharacterized protein n=1 Tax=Frigoriflavimonas asaccharolytica TaxID=2735899 RepID=A0A8J8G9T4_9FLAO|nr:hypothetical protein [Frigoriflavimonas asaccharolytica]